MTVNGTYSQICVDRTASFGTWGKKIICKQICNCLVVFLYIVNFIYLI